MATDTFSPKGGAPARADAPFLPLAAVVAQVSVVARDDGALLLSDPRPLAQPERTIVAFLRHWATHDPDRLMLAQRGSEGLWRKVSYGQMRRDVDAIAQGLLHLGLKPGQVLLILSGNSIEHAALALGAMTIGATVAPVSPAYALGAAGYAKLTKVFEALTPAMIFAEDWTQVAPAIALQNAASIPAIAVTGLPSGDRYTRFADLIASPVTGAVDDAYALTGPDTVAKILFSSGSTGWPKGVINTQRMLTTNMAMVDAMWAPEERTKPYVTLNWMPWNHTMAGNGLFHRSLRQGGAYYIDDGRPLAGEFERTLRNLREISPDSYSDVPVGYAMLTSALEQDAELAHRFFTNLSFCQYAGASLPNEVWKRFQAVAVATIGKRIPFLTGYGCTEAGPLITQLYWAVEGSGYIGVPVPGIEVKLIPVDAERYEVRARGPNLTPGYIGDPDTTAAAFDDEGYYRTGDAVTFVDRNAPVQGLRFASRVAEDFKLLTGTFVAVGILRASVVGVLSPLVTDLVVTGHDRAFVGALAWLDLAACRRLAARDFANLSEAASAPEVLESVCNSLLHHNRIFSGSSMRIERIMLLDEPPSPEANEITDKGYVNQRAVLERRAHLVERLYAQEPMPDVIRINTRGSA